MVDGGCEPGNVGALLAAVLLGLATGADDVVNADVAAVEEPGALACAEVKRWAVREGARERETSDAGGCCCCETPKLALLPPLWLWAAADT
jgi:hypothetical protein